MGTSTDAIICFGVSFEEDYEFPWDNDKWNTIEEWWLYGVCGYKNPFEIYNAAGDYIDGVEPSDDKIDEFYDTKKAFEEKHPLPVELVSHCASEFPMFIIAAKGTVIKANRGYPAEITNDNFTVTVEARESLLNFCKEHGIEGEPKWWLASDWC